MSRDGPVRILIIDDEEVVHQSLQRIFAPQGYEVQSALSVNEALGALEKSTPNLIITDLMMPGTDGIALLRTLRKMGMNVPVLMITGYPTIRTAVEAMRLGAVDYVAKPFTRNELLAPVRRALSMRPKAAPAPAEPPDANSLRPGAVFRLPNHSWARFEEDGSFCVGVEESFLEALGKVAAVDGPEELELVEQGHIAFKLISDQGDEHGVGMPLSGHAVAINRKAIENPSSIHAGLWLVRIRPTHLDTELPLLARAA